MRRRLISLALALVMMLSLVPSVAFAEESTDFITDIVITSHDDSVVAGGYLYAKLKNLWANGNLSYDAKKLVVTLNYEGDTGTKSVTYDSSFATDSNYDVEIPSAKTDTEISVKIPSDATHLNSLTVSVQLHRPSDTDLVWYFHDEESVSGDELNDALDTAAATGLAQLDTVQVDADQRFIPGQVFAATLTNVKAWCDNTSDVRYDAILWYKSSIGGTERAAGTQTLDKYEFLGLAPATHPDYQEKGDVAVAIEIPEDAVELTKLEVHSYLCKGSTSSEKDSYTVENLSGCVVLSSPTQLSDTLSDYADYLVENEATFSDLVLATATHAYVTVDCASTSDTHAGKTYGVDDPTVYTVTLHNYDTYTRDVVLITPYMSGDPVLHYAYRWQYYDLATLSDVHVYFKLHDQSDASWTEVAQHETWAPSEDVSLKWYINEAFNTENDNFQIGVRSSAFTDASKYDIAVVVDAVHYESAWSWNTYVERDVPGDLSTTITRHKTPNANPEVSADWWSTTFENVTPTDLYDELTAEVADNTVLGDSWYGHVEGEGTDVNDAAIGSYYEYVTRFAYTVQPSRLSSETDVEDYGEHVNRVGVLDFTADELWYTQGNGAWGKGDPKDATMTSLNEGWTWVPTNPGVSGTGGTLYLSHLWMENTGSNYSIKLPADSTIVVEDGSRNVILPKNISSGITATATTLGVTTATVTTETDVASGTTLSIGTVLATGSTLASNTVLNGVAVAERTLSSATTVTATTTILGNGAKILVDVEVNQKRTTLTDVGGDMVPIDIDLVEPIYQSQVTYGIYCAGDLTIINRGNRTDVGVGSLQIIGARSPLAYGVYAEGDLTIENVTMDVNASFGRENIGIAADGDITLRNAKVSVEAGYEGDNMAVGIYTPEDVAIYGGTTTINGVDSYTQNAVVVQSAQGISAANVLLADSADVTIADLNEAIRVSVDASITDLSVLKISSDGYGIQADGSVYVDNATLTASLTDFGVGDADGIVCAVWTNEDVFITDSVVTLNCEASDMAIGIRAAGDVKIDNFGKSVKINAESTTFCGGISAEENVDINNAAMDVDATNCAIYAGDCATLTNIVAGSTFDVTTADSAAIFAYNDLYVADSAFTATAANGTVVLSDSGDVTIEDSTITAASEANGVAILTGDGDVIIENSAVTATSVDGKAIKANSGKVDISNENGELIKASSVNELAIHGETGVSINGATLDVDGNNYAIFTNKHATLTNIVSGDIDAVGGTSTTYAMGALFALQGIYVKDSTFNATVGTGTAIYAGRRGNPNMEIEYLKDVTFEGANIIVARTAADGMGIAGYNVNLSGKVEAYGHNRQLNVPYAGIYGYNVSVTGEIIAEAVATEDNAVAYGIYADEDFTASNSNLTAKGVASGSSIKSNGIIARNGDVEITTSKLDVSGREYGIGAGGSATFTDIEAGSQVIASDSDAIFAQGGVYMNNVADMTVTSKGGNGITAGQNRFRTNEVMGSMTPGGKITLNTSADVTILGNTNLDVTSGDGFAIFASDEITLAVEGEIKAQGVMISESKLTSVQFAVAMVSSAIFAPNGVAIHSGDIYAECKEGADLSEKAPCSYGICSFMGNIVIDGDANVYASASDVTADAVTDESVIAQSGAIATCFGDVVITTSGKVVANSGDVSVTNCTHNVAAGASCAVYGNNVTIASYTDVKAVAGDVSAKIAVSSAICADYGTVAGLEICSSLPIATNGNIVISDGAKVYAENGTVTNASLSDSSAAIGALNNVTIATSSDVEVKGVKFGIHAKGYDVTIDSSEVKATAGKSAIIAGNNVAFDGTANVTASSTDSAVVAYNNVTGIGTAVLDIDSGNVGISAQNNVDLQASSLTVNSVNDGVKAITGSATVTDATTGKITSTAGTGIYANNNVAVTEFKTFEIVAAQDIEAQTGNATVSSSVAGASFKATAKEEAGIMAGNGVTVNGVDTVTINAELNAIKAGANATVTDVDSFSAKSENAAAVNAGGKVYMKDVASSTSIGNTRGIYGEYGVTIEGDKVLTLKAEAKTEEAITAPTGNVIINAPNAAIEAKGSICGIYAGKNIKATATTIEAIGEYGLYAGEGSMDVNVVIATSTNVYAKGNVEVNASDYMDLGEVDGGNVKLVAVNDILTEDITATTTNVYASATNVQVDGNINAKDDVWVYAADFDAKDVTAIGSVDFDVTDTKVEDVTGIYVRAAGLNTTTSDKFFAERVKATTDSDTYVHIIKINSKEATVTSIDNLGNGDNDMVEVRGGKLYVVEDVYAKCNVNLYSTTIKVVGDVTSDKVVTISGSVNSFEATNVEGKTGVVSNALNATVTNLKADTGSIKSNVVGRSNDKLVVLGSVVATNCNITLNNDTLNVAGTVKTTTSGDVTIASVDGTVGSIDAKNNVSVSKTLTVENGIKATYGVTATAGANLSVEDGGIYAGRSLDAEDSDALNPTVIKATGTDYGIKTGRDVYANKNAKITAAATAGGSAGIDATQDVYANSNAVITATGDTYGIKAKSVYSKPGATITGNATDASAVAQSFGIKAEQDVSIQSDDNQDSTVTGNAVSNNSIGVKVGDELKVVGMDGSKPTSKATISGNSKNAMGIVVDGKTYLYGASYLKATGAEAQAKTVELKGGLLRRSNVDPTDATHTNMDYHWLQSGSSKQLTYGYTNYVSALTAHKAQYNKATNSDVVFTGTYNKTSGLRVVNFVPYHNFTRTASSGGVSLGGSSSSVTTVKTTMPMLRKGNTGDDVKVLQQKLNSLGYNCGTADGVFGNATYNAVVKFQKDKGITADGVVGSQTWGKLGVSGTTVTVTTTTRVNSVSSTSTASSTVSKVMLRKGNTGDSVKYLQTRLNALGYNCGTVDGVFGNATYNAVVKFQTNKGLTADGIVGSLTWAKIG